MHRVSSELAIIVLIIQIFIFFGDESCGTNCVIDKEYLGITIFFNICFLVYAILRNKNDD